MKCLDGITDSVDISLSKFWEIVKDIVGFSAFLCKGSLMCCSPWGYKELDVTEQLNDKDEK